jgi:hypothetical protein
MPLLSRLDDPGQRPVTHGSNAALIVISANPNGLHEFGELLNATGNGFCLVCPNETVRSRGSRNKRLP